MSIMTRRAVVKRSTGEGIGHTNARRVEIEGGRVGFAGDTLGLMEGVRVALACPDCGAAFDREGDTCASRFEALLALDHSRMEPWGSRHGLAFSAFALQHPQRFSREVLERAWILLFKVYREEEEPKTVTEALRRFGKQKPNWTVPPLPNNPPGPIYRVTIASLGGFDAGTYPERLDAWCRDALEGWYGEGAATPEEDRSSEPGPGSGARRGGSQRPVRFGSTWHR